MSSVLADPDQTSSAVLVSVVTCASSMLRNYCRPLRLWKLPLIELPLSPTVLILLLRTVP